ncbi:flavin reductase family protein [Pseudomonas sp. GD04087]|uniref:flavin reductase family protein n=1 Tax=unclassified Pseudomonas TaxID=196821 RepID=UPI0024468CFE|nr:MULTISPECIES: flavin reductase family protein [unclassified Pseudomonas]MDH0288610.1 flavin reductase family protein [Pseudomonas sp. GD04087]MDH1049823.1 flavin reductase family protein [Pseudomonas sp. GD03903]MDH1998090.1 flavin reductase family protein [Pseudomonas sp. GD03691]
MLSFNFQQLSAREKYKILIGSVVPRPIALVTTIDAEGRANAAPFSFFNALSADPPILALGVENYSDLSPKDTTLNIRQNQEFTVNIVSDALVEAMNVCAVPFEPGFDELVAAGLTAIPGTRVGCPRIGEAPVALECRRMMALSIGQSREIILGEVLMAHVRDDLIDPATLYIDQLGLDAIGRMGGHGYSRTREYFDLPTRSLKQWMETPGAGQRLWPETEELA